MTTHILHRQIATSLPVAVGGRGVELFDAEGRAYIDASGGAAVSCLGHGHPDVIAAIHAQADKLAFAHSGFFTSEPAERLADRLAATAPEGIDHVYFVSGGSEAVETAIKMARQYFVEVGQPQRRRIIAREQSYHGNTLGALSAGGGGGICCGASCTVRCCWKPTTFRRAMPIVTSSRGKATPTTPSAPPTPWRRRFSTWGRRR